MAVEGDVNMLQFREDACFTIYAVCCTMLAYIFLPLASMHGGERTPLRFFLKFNMCNSYFVDCSSVKIAPRAL